MIQDEACFGSMSRPRRCWAPKGTRPVMLNGYERESNLMRQQDPDDHGSRRAETSFGGQGGHVPSDDLCHATAKVLAKETRKNNCRILV